VPQHKHTHTHKHTHARTYRKQLAREEAEEEATRREVEQVGLMRVCVVALQFIANINHVSSMLVWMSNVNHIFYNHLSHR